MLFLPEFHQCGGQPEAEAPEPVELRVAGRTHRRQPLGSVNPGFPVVDMRMRGHRAAAPALPPVPAEHSFPSPGKGAAGMGAGAVAARAKPGHRGDCLPAGAEKEPLLHGRSIAGG